MGISAQLVRPADNTAYAAGDRVAPADSTPMIFYMPFANGALSGCRCAITPSSGNVVITALDIDLLVFKPATNLPYASGAYPADNAAMTTTGAQYEQLVGAFRFSSGAWYNQVGTVVAGTAAYQSVSLNSSRQVAPFHLNPVNQYLIGLVRVLGAWTPTGIVNTFNFTLDAIEAVRA